MTTARMIWIYALIFPLFIFITSNMCVWPFPRFLGIVAILLLFSTPFWVLIVLGAVPTTISFACAALLSRERGKSRRRVSISLACLCFIALSVLAFAASLELRHRAFVKASHVGDKVVQAIAKYQKAKGEYPERLEQLLPEYLEEMPYTGMIGYPDFEYKKSVNISEAKVSEYQLRIYTTSSVLNFDCFIYWPSETYPMHLYGGGVERIRGWAYIHE